MFTKFYYDTRKLTFLLRGEVISLGFLIASLIFLSLNVSAQQTGQYFAQQTIQPSSSNPSVFRQEIARMEITVTRDGRPPLSLTQVPRVQKDDVIRLRLLDEPVNGIKIDQTQWDWTLLVAFINPLHRMIDETDSGDGQKKSGTVSEEIQFRKRGWYKQYSFVVPYDSQPVFFLYPKPKYRKQLVKLVDSKYDEIRKLGEKTIELADAYSKINTFVNEMQMVLNRNAQMFGYNNLNNSLTGSSTAYNPYATTYNPYSTYNPYGTTSTTSTTGSANTLVKTPVFGLQAIPALNQMVEGLAKSFNIQLPSCWGNGSGYGSNYGSSYGSNYGSSYSSYTPTYNSGSSYGGSSYGLGGYGNNTAAMDFISRSQCVAKNVSLQDFDISVTKMWQQGGVFLAAELQRKYPQLAYYINIAAVAIDFIAKVFQKSPLRIVPTVIQSNDPQGGFNNNSSVGGMYGNQSAYNFSNNNTGNPANNQNPGQTPVKISLFADMQPSEGEFTTAYPIVVHKWQANADPEVISLYPPMLAESCLHVGTNILKSTDLSSQLSEDVYSRDFRLVMSSPNGFKKEFPLRKNMGISGWELNITPEDMNQIPKINMALESELVGTRGFNEIRSPKFNLPISLEGRYEITAESQKAFSVGGKRTITLKNTVGSCRCLQRVTYKPSFGGNFVFESTTNQSAPNNLVYSADGSEVSFEIDTSNFQPGTGTLEVNTYGSDNQSTPLAQTSPQSPNSLPVKLYPAPPVISDVKVGRGDREILITGDRLEQLQAVYVNGKKAIVKDNPATGSAGNQNNSVSDTKTIQAPLPETTQPALSGSAQWNKASNQPAVAINTPPVTNAVTSPIARSSQYQNTNANQRIAVFEDPNTRINSKTITLELSLDDNRSMNYPNQFVVGSARPTIQANNKNEIEGTFLSQPLPGIPQNQADGGLPAGSRTKSSGQRISNQSSQVDLSGYPVVPINKVAMTVAVQNILSDYSFKNENLSVETRIENATTNPDEMPAVTFDFLDVDNLRLNFTFNRTINKYLSGRRLQFRIVDRERGNSDWYSIKQTFVRIPEIESVTCVNEMNNQCELKGTGLDYIAQVSTDGGRTWFPQTSNGPVQVQPTADGKSVMRVPMLLSQKLLQIKLRDYPNTEGLEVSNIIFSNRVRKNGSISSSAGAAGQPGYKRSGKEKVSQ